MYWYRVNLGTSFPLLMDRTTSTFMNVLHDTNSPEYKAVKAYDEFGLVYIGLDVHGIYLQTQAHNIECAQKRFSEIIHQVINALNIKEGADGIVEHAVVNQGIIKQGL